MNFKNFRVDRVNFYCFPVNRRWVIIGCLLFFTLNNLIAQDIEYRIKAGFLGKFTQFVDWPSGPAHTDSSSPFIIAVIGDNPFGTLLEDLYQGRKIKDRSIEIRYLQKVRDISEVDLLFISRSEQSNLDKILARTGNRPILTVSDSKGFCERGVLINFYKSEGYIRFEINYTAVLKSGLHFSSRLLKLARIINWSGENQ